MLNPILPSINNNGGGEEPEIPSFDAFQYFTGDLKAIEIVKTQLLNGAVNGFQSTVANTVCAAISTDKFIVLNTLSLVLYVKIYKYNDDNTLELISSYSKNVGGTVRSVAVISENYFKAVVTESNNNLRFIEITVDENNIISYIDINALVRFSNVISRNYKNFLVDSTCISIGTSSDSFIRLEVLRYSKNVGSAIASLNAITTSKQAQVPPAHDFLGKKRFICGSLGSKNGEASNFQISVFDADDDSVRLLGTAQFLATDTIENISVFALSPTLAVASFTVNRVQRAIAISITNKGIPKFLGTHQTAGTFAYPLLCACTLNPTTLLVAVTPVDTQPSRLVKITVNENDGVMTEQVIKNDYPIQASTSARFDNILRLSDTKAVVIQSIRAAPFGIAIDLVKLKDSL